MIDNFSIFSIIIRTIAACYFLLVFKKQYKVYRREVRVRDYQLDLVGVVALLFISNGFTIYFNFFRNDDGNLIDIVRHISQVLSGLSFLAVALMLFYRIYRDR